jgi:hypothetical protein
MSSSKVSCVFVAKIRLSANLTSNMRSLIVSNLANTSFIYMLKRCGNNRDPCGNPVSSYISSLLNCVEELVTKYLQSCCSCAFQNFSLTTRLLRWKRFTVLYAFERSIWHIQISFEFVCALTNVLNRKCWASSGPMLWRNLNWVFRRVFVHMASCLKRCFYNIFIMFEQICIGWNLPLLEV